MKPERLLVIEDNAEIRENLVEIIEMAGYEVVSTNGGRKGIQMAQNGVFDLIMCDLAMPDCDGYEVLRSLKNNKATRQLPVVIVSAITETEALKRAFSEGATDYIFKPFDGQELLDRLANALQRC